MTENHGQSRIDRLIEGQARVEQLAKGIDEKLDRHLNWSNDKTTAIEVRLSRTEHRIFAIWVLGPIAVGALAALVYLRKILVP